MLSLEAPCDAGGEDFPSINSDANVDSSRLIEHVRGLTMLRPPGCTLSDADLAKRLYPSSATRPKCDDGGPDRCGPHAVCSDTPLNGKSALGFFPTCSCSPPNVPVQLSTMSEVVTPYTHGCDTPRMGVGVGVAALAIESIVLELLKPTSGSRTLTLRMTGTMEALTTWSIDPSSVPPWLTLDAYSGILPQAASPSGD